MSHCILNNEICQGVLIDKCYLRILFRMQNLWQQLKKPIWILAPMYDVTDVAFREMFAKYGKPDLMVTEFVSVDALLSEKGRQHALEYLRYSETQRPIIAQIWGSDPEKFNQAAALVAELGFDGIDINMGCPQDSEIKVGACAALINNPELAKQIILATMEGASGLPVSVKTRLGYNQLQTEEWIGHLLETNLAAITLHARTKKEMSKVPAHWDEITKAVLLRDNLGKPTLIIGNGDVKSREEGLQRIQETGCDGVMVGRGAFGNPWFFSDVRKTRGREKSEQVEVTLEQRLKVMIEHALLFEASFNNTKHFMIMRKHFKAYASGFDGAAELRAQLMETKNAAEVAALVENFLINNKII